MRLEALKLSPEKIQSLRRELLSRKSEVTPFREAPRLAEQIASLGICREVGTVNDEIARFLFDARTGEAVVREDLRAELVTLGRHVGVSIWCESSPVMELRIRGLRDLLHPRFSFHPDGTIHRLVVFPAVVAEILRGQGIEAVLVKTWGRNSLFGGFDPSKGYYQTNFWELENNDALLFSQLVKNRELAFLGTHDLVAHIAGAKAEHWPLLVEQATRVHSTIADYFGATKTPSIAALILPYTLGTVLDDLAQPPSYGSKNHAAVLGALLTAVHERHVPADLKTILVEFPAVFQQVIELSRTKGIENDLPRVRGTVAELTRRIREKSLRAV